MRPLAQVFWAILMLTGVAAVAVDAVADDETDRILTDQILAAERSQEFLIQECDKASLRLADCGRIMRLTMPEEYAMVCNVELLLAGAEVLGVDAPAIERIGAEFCEAAVAVDAVADDETDRILTDQILAAERSQESLIQECDKASLRLADCGRIMRLTMPEEYAMVCNVELLLAGAEVLGVDAPAIERIGAEFCE